MVKTVLTDILGFEDIRSLSNSLHRSDSTDDDDVFHPVEEVVSMITTDGKEDDDSSSVTAVGVATTPYLLPSRPIRINRHKSQIKYDSDSESSEEDHPGGAARRSTSPVGFKQEEEEEEGLLAMKTKPVPEALLSSLGDKDGGDTVMSIDMASPSPLRRESLSDEEEWNYATALDDAILPFLQAVCLPTPLTKSLGWGSPNHYIQFTNYSTGWNLELNWLDEEGVLIPRKEIRPGHSHFEVSCTDHVWAVVAMANHPKGMYRGAASLHASGSYLSSLDTLHSENNHNLGSEGGNESTAHPLVAEHAHAVGDHFYLTQLIIMSLITVK